MGNRIRFCTTVPSSKTSIRTWWDWPLTAACPVAPVHPSSSRPSTETRRRQCLDFLRVLVVDQDRVSLPVTKARAIRPA